MPKRKTWIAGLLLILASVGVAGAQQNIEGALSAQLVGKPLYLKGAWMQDDLHFTATGQPASHYKTGPFTLAGFNATSVDLKGDNLVITGDRIAMTFNKDGVIKRVPVQIKPKTVEHITISIDGNGKKDFSNALGAIFSDGLAGLIPVVPDFWKNYASQRFTAAASEAYTPLVHTPGALRAGGGGVSAPQLTDQPKPEFSKAALQQHYSGVVQVYLWVDANGTPSHLQISRPLGFGLDEEAVKAVSKYRFSPSMRDGKPVAVELLINVSFKFAKK